MEEGMSETRDLRSPAPADGEDWRLQFDELELRVEGLRRAFLEGVRSFTDCTYPFGGRPGQDDCRFEPKVAYDSDAQDPAAGLA
jgi:hypothetical protein